MVLLDANVNYYFGFLQAFSCASAFSHLQDSTIIPSLSTPHIACHLTAEDPSGEDLQVGWEAAGDSRGKLPEIEPTFPLCEWETAFVQEGVWVQLNNDNTY